MSTTVIFIIGAILLFILRGMVWSVIWHVVRFFLWNPKMILLGGVFFLGYISYEIWNAPDLPEPMSPPSEGEQTAPAADKRLPGSGPDPVTYPTQLPALPSPAKDGNSRFAEDLLTRMSSGERRYYSREFYHAIEKSAENAPHHWEYKSGDEHMFGQIIPGQKFTPSSGTVCRPFSEVLVIGQNAQNLSGYACQQPQGGWCKLRPGSAYTCGLAPPSGLDGTMIDLKRTFRRWSF